MKSLLAALALLVFAAPRAAHCCDTFYRVTETDTRGDILAEWIVKGNVWQDEFGYKIKAFQRKAFDPPIRVRYPYGRLFVISPPHISIKLIPRPAWLDAYAVTTTATSSVHDLASK